MVALGTFVFCGVSGAAIFMGVSAAGGISALEDRWDQESGLTWLTVTSVGTVVSFILLVWSCMGKQAYYNHQPTHQNRDRFKK